MKKNALRVRSGKGSEARTPHRVRCVSGDVCVVGRGGRLGGSKEALAGAGLGALGIPLSACTSGTGSFAPGLLTFTFINPGS